MKDAFGTDVKIGDKVVFITGYDPRQLSKGYISDIFLLKEDEEYSGAKAGTELANIKCSNFVSKEFILYRSR